MTLKLSRRYRRWIRTRDRRQLWWSIPALLAITSWLALGFCLAAWQPDQFEVDYSGIAKEALAARDFETARVAAQRLLAAGAGSRDNWLFQLALADAGLNRDREASALFNAVAPVDRPGYLHAHMFVAQALLSKTNVTAQDIKTAERHLIHALSLAPKLGGANELLARLYLRNGQWSLAAERLREIAADRPEAALLLAAALKARGNAMEAETHAVHAAKLLGEKVKTSPVDLPRIRLAWVEALVLLEDYPEAFEVLKQGWDKSLNKTYSGPIGEVCSAWAQSVTEKKPANLETRLDIIQQGLRYAPQNLNLIKQLIALTHEGSKSDAAREALARLLAEGKSTAVLHLALGIDAWQRGKLELARKHFTLSFESAPQMPEVANNMAMILAVGDQPDLPRALAIIQSVLERFPEQPNFRETRGQILAKMGRWQEAVIDLEYALPKLVSTRATHEALAEAYKSLGSQPLAAEHLRMAKASGDQSAPAKD
jgi:tetratricopeptide (TPR) repeat protein